MPNSTSGSLRTARPSERLTLESKGRGRTSFDLNGLWAIAPSMGTEIPEEFPSAIPVPSVVDCAQPAYDWAAASFHWYKRSLSVRHANSELVFLTISQSQFGTDVLINGFHAGRSIACYTTQEFDITRFLKPGGRDNEIVIRVGRKEDLPAESAVGKDQEKEIYTPGIWGNVSLTVCSVPRIKGLLMLPNIHRGTFTAKVFIEGRPSENTSGIVEIEIFEKQSGRKASETYTTSFAVAAGRKAEVQMEIAIERSRLWSPEDPFLYEARVAVRRGSETCDEVRVCCGLRDFRIEEGEFRLNGRRVFLKGSNIAFHRFLADRQRGLLPWDRDWINKILIEIPRAHHFNFFRNHLGQMYPLWYDIADERGMLIQNEWHFWGRTGAREQIQEEFSQWVLDNGNHPSVILWDALNESTDETVQNEIIPEMKRLDPSRPWEPTDVLEEHPYIYSLGPVLNEGRFGFARGIAELEQSRDPVMLNEFLWWWIDSNGRPTRLMDGVTERWLGPSPKSEDIIARQSFLATELVELFRRIRADAIQPFVYLSNDEGPTAHWFQGALADPTPKPVMAALRNAFSPVGVSIELWDRHFTAGEQRSLRVFVMNDEPQDVSAELEWGIAGPTGDISDGRKEQVQIEGGGCRILHCSFDFPKTHGTFDARARIRWEGKTALSSKIVHVVSDPRVETDVRNARMAVLEYGTEISEFLSSHGVHAKNLLSTSILSHDLVVLGPGTMREREGAAAGPALKGTLDSGGSVLIIEPEFGLEEEARLSIGDTIEFTVKKREDREKGGYDSHVFPAEESHPIWRGLNGKLFQMFNGGLGGEIVSQHDMTIKTPHEVLARCGLHLRVCAVAEGAAGKGRVLISRIQTRGRLSSSGATGLYDRRPDPVARQFFLNLLSYLLSKRAPRKEPTT